MVGNQNIDIEQSIQLNIAQFDDEMFIQKGFTGKQLERAAHKYGILEKKLKDAKKAYA